VTTPEFVSALDGGGFKPKRTQAGWTSRCPGHEDRSPSLSISEGHDGKVLLKCFAGCVVERIAAGLGWKEADLFPSTRRINIPTSIVRPLAKLGPTQEVAPRQWPEFVAPIEDGGMEEHLAYLLLRRVASIRGLSVEGLMLAAERGLLRFTAHGQTLAWVITDGARLNAQARRFDGKPWTQLGGKKAWTLRGSRARWPIGAQEAKPFKTVLLTEGGPDLLAAHHFMVVHGRERDVAAVGMLGAANAIPDDSLPLFTGKRVRIFAHVDQAGIEGASRWKSQLELVGAVVDIADLRGLLRSDGREIKDLNDAAMVRAADAGRLEGLIP